MNVGRSILAAVFFVSDSRKRRTCRRKSAALDPAGEGCIADFFAGQHSAQGRQLVRGDSDLVDHRPKVCDPLSADHGAPDGHGSIL